MKFKGFGFVPAEQKQLRAAKRVEEESALVAKRQAEKNAHDIRDAEIRANSKWKYSEHVDEMRGTSMSLAQIVSNNSVDLPFPWAGGSFGIIMIRQLGPDYEVVFAVNQGQFRFGRMV